MQRASSSSHEAEADRELSSTGVRTRGRRPRILTARRKLWSAVMTALARRPRLVTVRDNFQSRSPSAKCCELYTSLHDRFRLEVRILFYPLRTWELGAWVTLIKANFLIKWDNIGVEISENAKKTWSFNCQIGRATSKYFLPG